MAELEWLVINRYVQMRYRHELKTRSSTLTKRTVVDKDGA